MPPVYNTSTINGRMTVVLNALDAGSSNARLQIGTTNFISTLSTIQLGKPSGVVANGVLTINVPYADPLIANSGVAQAARMIDSAGNVIVSGLTVGVSTGFDVVVSSINLSSGDTLALISGQIIGS